MTIMMRVTHTNEKYTPGYIVFGKSRTAPPFYEPNGSRLKGEWRSLTLFPRRCQIAPPSLNGAGKKLLPPRPNPEKLLELSKELEDALDH
jgi:hypothetical protein